MCDQYCDCHRRCPKCNKLKGPAPYQYPGTYYPYSPVTTYYPATYPVTYYGQGAGKLNVTMATTSGGGVTSASESSGFAG